MPDLLFDFDDIERPALDGGLAEPSARIRELLAASLEEHKGDFAIVADLIEAVVRYRHLVRSAFDSSTRLLLSEGEAEVLEHLEQLASPRLRTGAYKLADELRAL